jgi:hypothetical protein
VQPRQAIAIASANSDATLSCNGVPSEMVAEAATTLKARDLKSILLLPF